MASVARAAVLAILLGCGGGGAAVSGSASAVVVSSAGTPAASIGPAATAVASANAGPKASDPLSGAAIHADATYLSTPRFRGRGSGTEDEALARAWLVERLEEARVAAPSIGRTQTFEYGRPSDRKKSANVLALVAPDTAPAPASVLVLGAHYDHVGVQQGATYYGAEDNASGTAVVLAVTRALNARRAELGRPVLVAFFGAEEVGLQGSFAFVRAWEFDEAPIDMMVNVDMIGRPLVDQPLLWLGARALGVLQNVDPDRAVGALLPAGDAALAGRVKSACEAEGVRAVVTGDLPESLRGPIEDLSRGRGDHYPFEKKGIPFVFFSSGESTDYHEPTDTPDKLDAEILEGRARAILRFVIESAKR
jgi:hypothetical protein